MRKQRLVESKGALCGVFLTTLLMAAMSLAADPPKGPTTQSILATAHRLHDQKKWDEAVKTCEQVIAMTGAAAGQKIEAFEIMVDVYRRQKNMEKALATAVRFGAEMPNVSEAQTQSSVLQGDLNLELGNKALALTHYTAAAEHAENLHVRQTCICRVATLHAAEARYDDASAWYERVFVDAPAITDHWAEAQRGIVDALRKANRLPEALQAARICFNSVSDANGISANTQLIATILKDIDKNVTRANAWLDYQQYGPVGKDGKPGTADDLTNPLAAVAYPSYQQRERAFAQARAVAGDDAAASRYRALSYVYTGHPAEALQHFAETFRRSRTDAYPMLGTVQELVAIGVRGVQGHAVGLERFYEFVRCGPAGPDGKPGTADDLKDPFGDVGLKARTPSDDGGLVSPSEADRLALVELRKELESMAVAEREDSQFRQAVLIALDRVHTALCDWGTKGQVEWYLQLLPDLMANEYECSTLLVGGEGAARGSDLHFGGVVRFWQEVDASGCAEKIKIWGQTQGVRNGFLGSRQLLEKPQSLAPSLPPLK